MSPSRPASLSLRCKLENEPWSWTPIIATLGNTWRASGLRLSNAHIVEQISEAGPGGPDQYLRHFYLRRDSLWHSRKSGFKVLTPIKAFGQSIRDKLRENGGAEPPEHKCSFLHGLLGLAARLGVSLAVFFLTLTVQPFCLSDDKVVNGGFQILTPDTQLRDTERDKTKTSFGDSDFSLNFAE